VTLRKVNNVLEGVPSHGGHAYLRFSIRERSLRANCQTSSAGVTCAEKWRHRESRPGGEGQSVDKNDERAKESDRFSELHRRSDG